MTFIEFAIVHIFGFIKTSNVAPVGLSASLPNVSCAIFCNKHYKIEHWVCSIGLIILLVYTTVVRNYLSLPLF